MHKSDIKKILKKYNFDPQKYIVVSGSAMVMYGLKKFTHDVDISVTEDLFIYLLQHFDCKLERINKFGKKVFYIDNVINFGTDFYSPKSCIIDGIPVQNIQELKKTKEAMGRKKDIADLKLINQYLKSL